MLLVSTSNRDDRCAPQAKATNTRFRRDRGAGTQDEIRRPSLLNLVVQIELRNKVQTPKGRAAPISNRFAMRDICALSSVGRLVDALEIRLEVEENLTLPSCGHDGSCPQESGILARSNTEKTRRG